MDRFRWTESQTRGSAFLRMSWSRIHFISFLLLSRQLVSPKCPIEATGHVLTISSMRGLTLLDFEPSVQRFYIIWCFASKLDRTKHDHN